MVTVTSFADERVALEEALLGCTARDFTRLLGSKRNTSPVAHTAAFCVAGADLRFQAFGEGSNLTNMCEITYARAGRMLHWIGDPAREIQILQIWIPKSRIQSNAFGLDSEFEQVVHVFRNPIQELD